MLEIRSILAPTDFSRHSEGALRFACGLAERFGATLHLLHVLPEVIAPVGPDPALVTTLPVEYYRDAQAESLEALRKVLNPSWGIPAAVEASVHWGDPVEGVVSYARDRGIGLVVIATHGRTGLSHVLLGSLAESILRECPCPVLTIQDHHQG